MTLLLDIIDSNEAPEVDAVGTDDLAEQICTLAGHMTAATCRWLLLVAEFDRREGWVAAGIMSCAHWLSWRCGIAGGTARDQVRVARKMVHLPEITALFAKGQLSYAKVRALTRIATAENEVHLIELAQEATAAQLEKIISEFKAAEREALGDRSETARSPVSALRYDQDGSMIITARLAPEDGALVVDVLEDIIRADSGTTPDVSAEAAKPDPTLPADVEPDNIVEPGPGEHARADALVAMAQRASNTLGDDVVSTADRAHLLVMLDGKSVLGQPGGECHLANGPAIAYETACRLGCDGTMAILVRDDEGNPLHLGDTTPTVTRRQKHALLARDRGCTFPGCGARRYLHAHHIKHWVKGGPTCISNLLLLCGHHHRLMHEGGFTVRGANGNVTFRRPGGFRIDAVPVLSGDSDAIRAENDALGLEIDADTAGSLSNGERCDHGMVSDLLWCLLHPEYILGTEPAPRPGEHGVVPAATVTAASA